MILGGFDSCLHPPTCLNGGKDICITAALIRTEEKLQQQENDAYRRHQAEMQRIFLESSSVKQDFELEVDHTLIKQFHAVDEKTNAEVLAVQQLAARRRSIMEGQLAQMEILSRQEQAQSEVLARQTKLREQYRKTQQMFHDEMNRNKAAQRAQFTIQQELQLHEGIVNPGECMWRGTKELKQWQAEELRRREPPPPPPEGGFFEPRLEATKRRIHDMCVREDNLLRRRDYEMQQWWRQQHQQDERHAIQQHWQQERQMPIHHHAPIRHHLQ